MNQWIGGRALFGAAATAAAMLAVSGCATPPRDDSIMAEDARQKVIKVMPAPPKPPEAPPAVATALDPALRARAKAEIVAAARSNDTVTRANAMEAAQNALGAAEGAPIVLGGLNDDKPLVRFAAAMAAGSLQLDTARPRLLELAADPDDSVKVAVRFALHKLGDYRLSHDLERYAVAPDPRVRGNTAMVLGLLGEKSALKVLRPMQDDVNVVVRLQVAEAMWRLGDMKGLETLVSAVISQYPDDQMVAVQAIAAPRDVRAARPYVQGKLTTPYDEVNLTAARAMGVLGEDAGYAIATKGARAADPRQRHLAALALGAIGRADAQATLATLLGDREQPVRLAAAMAIWQLRDNAAPSAAMNTPAAPSAEAR